MPQYHDLRNSLEKHVSEREKKKNTQVLEVSNNPIKFLEKYCKLKPYWYLLDLIQNYEKFQFDENAVRSPKTNRQKHRYRRLTPL